MPVLGITGGLASGKSAVCSLLKQYGATVFSADEAARAVLLPGNSLMQAIACEFGPEMLLADGSLDRPRLGRQIFADETARQRLEALMHPPILRLLQAQIETAQYESSAGTLIAAEVPLLFEKNLSSWFDRIAVVSASETIQIERLCARNGLDEAEARRRLAAQWPLAQKRRLADYVLENNGTLQALEIAVKALCEQWKAAFPALHEKK